MKKKLATVLLTTITASTLFAGNYNPYGFKNFEITFKLGFTSGTVAEESQSKPEFEIMTTFNKKSTYQNRIGYDVIFTGSNSNANDGDGNLGYIYYSGAYKYSDTILPYFTVGYGFIGGAETLSGMGVSAGVEYKLTNHINISAEYKYINLDTTDANVAAVKLGYTF